MKIVRLRPRGQLTLPKQLRQQVGLKDEATLSVYIAGSRLILEPVEFSSYPTRDYTQADINRFLKEDKLSPALARKVKQLLK